MNLKELSSLLNLSQTTVSRALNGYPEVSEDTRVRVQHAAEKHNYKPNTRAKSLATGRTMAIGHVIPITSYHEMVSNPIFGDFVSGASEVYSARGFDMNLTVVEIEREEYAYRQIKNRGSVDGIVVHGPRMEDSRIPLLQEIGLPFVVHGRASSDTSSYSWVDVNNRRAFKRATDFLFDLGHSKIALLNGLEHMDFAHRRRQGYEDAFAERGLMIDTKVMDSQEMTEVYGYRSAMEMLSWEQAPTAFITSSMVVAIGVRRALTEKGLVMGRDVSIITHDDCLSYLQNGADVPIFTATRSSVREAGRKSAELLLKTIQNPLSAPLTELMEAELMVGQSTGPAPRG